MSYIEKRYRNKIIIVIAVSLPRCLEGHMQNGSGIWNNMVRNPCPKHKNQELIVCRLL